MAGEPTVRECPGCGAAAFVRVFETRRSRNETVVRRVHCTACGCRWRTREAL